MEKTQEMMYHNSSFDYSIIVKELYYLEDKIDEYSNYNYFVVNLLKKCETYYKENKELKTPYMDGVSFIDYKFPISYADLSLLFNIRIWNFKTRSHISYENTKYFSVPFIHINENTIEISIDLPLISGHYSQSSIDEIGRILTKIPYQITLNQYNDLFSLEERQTFDNLLNEFRNIYSHKSVIKISERNNRHILDFISLRDEKLQNVLISLWLYAMNECASIYQSQTIEKDKMEINDDTIFEFNTLSSIGGGINKHGVEISSDMLYNL